MGVGVGREGREWAEEGGRGGREKGRRRGRGGGGIGEGEGRLGPVGQVIGFQIFLSTAQPDPLTSQRA